MALCPHLPSPLGSGSGAASPKVDREMRSWVSAVHLVGIPGGCGEPRPGGGKPAEGASLSQVPPAAARGSGVPLSNRVDDTGELSHHGARRPDCAGAEALCTEDVHRCRGDSPWHIPEEMVFIVPLLQTWRCRLSNLTLCAPRCHWSSHRCVGPRISGVCARGAAEVPGSVTCWAPTGREHPALHPKPRGRRSSVRKTDSSAHTGSGF